MELRGFDSYDVTLGDQMRGERASLGKTLEDAERELRIKADMLVAIEDCDLSGFKNPSVISGYVRSYARYLGMDPEDCYRRFCSESGYRSPAALMSASGDGSGFGSLRDKPVTAPVGNPLGHSRFAAPPSRSRFRARISLGAVTSAAAMLALIAGLGYGGYALLQDIQRVGFAPLPEAPVVVAQAPSIAQPAAAAEVPVRPSASDYSGGGALASYSAPTDMPPPAIHRRDGPISAIDPARAGTFARVTPPSPPIEPAGDPDRDNTTAVFAAANPEIPAAAEPEEPVERGIVLHAAAKAWVKITGRDDATIWQGTLQAGERYRLPDGAIAPTVRTGNAGKTFVLVDGVAYGPLGEVGRIAKNISLVPEDVRRDLPEAEAEAYMPPAAGSTEQRADARTDSN